MANKTALKMAGQPDLNLKLLPKSAHWTARLTLLPGLAMIGVITLIAFALRSVPGVSIFSPLILAIVLGMGLQNTLGTPSRALPAVRFSIRKVLRLAIVLLGLQLTVTQIKDVGGLGLGVIVTTLLATFAFTAWLGRCLNVDRKLTELIAAGTSICGASAVIATNTVTDAPEEDVAYAIACVTVFGSISMFLYPLMEPFVHLNAKAFGLWSGASIHEIAQVVACTFQDGQSAGEFGTIVKLSRVAMLAPVVIGLSWLTERSRGAAPAGEARPRPPLPWFVLGFAALMIVNSVVTIPADIKQAIALLTTVLLSMALCAMGLDTDVRKLRAKGMRPLLLGAGAWIFISALSLALTKTIT